MSSDRSNVGKRDDDEPEAQQHVEEPDDTESTMVRPTAHTSAASPANVPTGTLPPSPPDGEPPAQSARGGTPLDVSFWARLAILSLGVTAVIVGVVLAIIPAGSNSEHARRLSP